MEFIETVLTPIQWVSFVVALPIKVLTWVLNRLKSAYDPEKAVCPACGFKGDNGGKTCRIRFIRTTGIEKGAIEHDCLRCSALFHSKVFVSVDKWASPITTPEQDKTARIKNASL